MHHVMRWSASRHLQKLIGGPLKLNFQLDLTNACNLRCVHCYHPHHLDQGTLKTQDWIKVIEKISSFCKSWNAIPFFLLCGGEPTLSPSFEAVLKKIRTYWPTPSLAEIVVLTNGTNLDQIKLNHQLSPLDLMNQYQTRAQISLDGATNNTHDKIRGKGSFEKSIHGITLLQCTQIPIIIQTENLFGDDLKAAMHTILTCSQQTGVPTHTEGALWALLDPKLGSADRLGFYDFNNEQVQKFSRSSTAVTANRVSHKVPHHVL